jgi:3-oxoadipate enol-lactonase
MEFLRTTSSPSLAVSVARPNPAQARNQAIVFLHGIGSHRQHWDEQLAFFASQGYLCAAPDMRGYGESEDYAGELNFITDFCADVAATLDCLGLEEAHLVGLSMGGRVARWCAVRMPQRVTSLTLANTQPGFDALGAEASAAFVRNRVEALESGASLSELAQRLSAGLLGPQADARAHARLHAAMAALHRESYLKTVRASVVQDRECPLEKIQQPTLVIAGAEDRLYPPALCETFVKRMPYARMQVLEHAGHLSNLEVPDAFNACVLEFLASVV